MKKIKIHRIDHIIGSSKTNEQLGNPLQKDVKYIKSTLFFQPTEGKDLNINHTSLSSVIKGRIKIKEKN